MPKSAIAAPYSARSSRLRRQAHRRYNSINNPAVIESSLYGTKYARTVSSKLTEDMKQLALDAQSDHWESSSSK